MSGWHDDGSEQQHQMTKAQRLKELPKSPAVVTDLQRLDSRLSDAAYRMRDANIELQRAELAHREASDAVDAELRRLARATVKPGAEQP